MLDSVHAQNDTRQKPLLLAPALGGGSVSQIKGLGIFFDKTGDVTSTPAIFIQFLQKFQATPTAAVFFHIRPVSVPSIDPEDRFTIARCFPGLNVHPTAHNFFNVTLRHGYTDEVVTPDLGMVVYEEIRKFVIREEIIPMVDLSEAVTSSGEEPSRGHSCSIRGAPETLEIQRRHVMQSSVQHRLDSIEVAYKDRVTYIVGKEQMRVHDPDHIKGWARRTVLATFLWLRGNTGSRVANFNLDVEKLVEIGFVKVI